MRNVYGRALTEAEAELAQIYESLVHVLREHRDELAPFEQRNAMKALGAMWQIVNGLDLEPGQVYHLGA